MLCTYVYTYVHVMCVTTSVYVTYVYMILNIQCVCVLDDAINVFLVLLYIYTRWATDVTGTSSLYVYVNTPFIWTMHYMHHTVDIGPLPLSMPTQTDSQTEPKFRCFLSTSKEDYVHVGAG